MVERESVCVHHSGIEARLEAQCKKTDLHFAMLDRQVSNTRDELERRLGDMQAHTFATKAELRIVETRVLELKERADKILGGTKWLDHIITVLIGIAVIMAVWMITKT